MSVIEARGLRKSYGANVALDGIDLRVDEGRIIGLIGPNGAGKSTALNAILGLTPYQGELRVLDRDPWTSRHELMRDVSFIADVAVLPRWMRVSQALDYVSGVHPRFDRAKAEVFLARTDIKRGSRIRELSKGMITQLHLALVMAIDARLLVLDEPTLGLDILYRKQFYDSLLNDYFDRSRTILVTTHQVEEVQHVLTDVMFIQRGRIVLASTMEEFESRYSEVQVHPEQLAAARALRPIYERPGFGRSVLLFDRVDRAQLATFGEVRTPSIADLFVAEDFDGQLAIENLLADFGDTLRAQRIRGTRPAQRGLGLLIRLEQGLVRPLGLGRRILLDPVEALEYRPCACGGDCNGFLHILHWLVHVLSLSTAWDYGKSGICHFSLGKTSQPTLKTVEPVEPAFV